MCASITCSAVWFLVYTDEVKFHLPVDDANQEVITFMVVVYKRLDQMHLWLHLCSFVRWLGTHLAKTQG